MICEPTPELQPNGVQHKNSLYTFLQIEFPPAEPLIEGLLNRREFCALIGRRRHGKTTFLLNAALALTLGKPEFLNYRILAKCRVVGFFLEDDPAELQEKLRTMIGNEPIPEGFHIYTKADFLANGIPIDVKDDMFKEFVKKACEEAKPDLIIFDNLAHLIRADYNNPKKIDEVVRFVYLLQTTYNAAVVIAVHPRKRGGKPEDTVNLEFDPERFFEECMGSSHFINSAGTLWGIERVRQEEKTVFVGGTQRRDGSQGVTPLEMRDGWFVIVDDLRERLKAVLNTDKRQAAWKVLPNNGPFSRAKAEKLAKPHLSHCPFLNWWDELKRKKVITEISSGRFQKVTPLV